MNTKPFFLKPAIAFITFPLLIILAAWAGNPQNTIAKSFNILDTIPGKKESKEKKQLADRDLDKEIRQLDKAKKQLEELRNQDWGKIKKEVEESLKSIDSDKIRMEAEKAIKEIDIAKIEKELESAIQKIDLEKIEKDLEKSLEEIDIKASLNKVRQELQHAKIEIEQQLKNKDWRNEVQQELKKINTEEIKKELENVRLEMQKVKIEIGKEKDNMFKELEKGRKEINKAKEELKGYQEMIYEMEKEGLLNTKEDYKIEYSNEELIINNKKQSAETIARYKKYFKKEKITITKEDNEFNLDID